MDEEDASQEWMHLVATIDTCAISSPTHFCDEDGYDVVPIRVITPVYTMEATLKDESIQETIYQAKQALSEKQNKNVGNGDNP